jgi:hypothetical protein
MDARALLCMVAAATMVSSRALQAESPPAVCELPAIQADLLLERERLLAEFGRLPQSCLRELFAACSSAANDALLDFRDAAICSLAYEALLQQGFGGDFQALMAWWRRQRER